MCRRASAGRSDVHFRPVGIAHPRHPLAPRLILGLGQDANTGVGEPADRLVAIVGVDPQRERAVTVRYRRGIGLVSLITGSNRCRLPDPDRALTDLQFDVGRWPAVRETVGLGGAQQIAVEVQRSLGVGRHQDGEHRREHEPPFVVGTDGVTAVTMLTDGCGAHRHPATGSRSPRPSGHRAQPRRLDPGAAGSFSVDGEPGAAGDNRSSGSAWHPRPPVRGDRGPRVQ